MLSPTGISKNAFAYVVLFAIVSTCLAVYQPMLDGPFLYDDVKQIEKNEKIQQLETEGWSSVIWNGKRQNRLLQNITFGIDWFIGNGDPRIFKITNLIFHLLCCLLAYLFFRKFFSQNSWPLLIITCLFTLHPLQTQPVDLIMGRCSLLYSIAFFACLLTYNMNGWQRILLFNLGATMAVISKETVVVLPIILFLYSKLILGENLRAFLSQKNWIFFGIVLSFVPFNAFMSEPVSMHENVVGFDIYPPFTYLLNQLHYFRVYIQMIIDPSKQSLLHPFLELSPELMVSSTIGAIGIASLSFIIVLKKFRVNFVAFCVLVFFVHLAPTNGPLQMINPFAEYRLYFSNFFAFSVIGYALSFVKNKNLTGAIFFVIFLFCSFHTLKLNKIWGNSYAIYAHAANNYPDNFETVMMAGNQFEKQNDCVGAIPYYYKAAHLAKKASLPSAKPLFRLAVCHTKTQEWELALESLNSIPVENLKYGPPEEYYMMRLIILYELQKFDLFDQTYSDAIKRFPVDNFEYIKSKRASHN